MSFASLLDFAARCGGSFFALFTMSPGKSPSPVLIIEPFPYHEQVFLPMVEVFSSLGQAVDLVTVPGALVLNSERELLSDFPRMSLYLESLGSLSEIVDVMLRYRVWRYRTVIISTATKDTWRIVLLALLMARRVSIVVHHTDQFPSPVCSMKTVFGRIFSFLVSWLVYSFILLSEETAVHLKCRTCPRVSQKIKVFRPLVRCVPRRLESSKVRFAVPGAINPQRRNYESLLQALEELGDSVNDVEILLIGSGQEHCQSMLERFRQIPQVKLLLKWVSQDEFAKSLADCHYLLPLVDGTVELAYGKLRVASSFFWGEGLPLPMILSDDYPNLGTVGCSSGILYYGAKRSLSAVMREGVDLVFSGTYPDLYRQILDRRGVISLRNEKMLASLLTFTGGSASLVEHHDE